MQSSKEVLKPLSELTEVVKVGDIAMLTTIASEQDLNSRPMETCFINTEGQLFFYTTLDTHLSEELINDIHINVTYIHEAEHEYVSVSGKAVMYNDHDDLVAYWQEKYTRWIPAGLTDPNLVLLKIIPTTAEYWRENSKIKAIVKNMLFGKNEGENFHKIMRDRR